ncbi:holo-ACP synthase, partial [Streptomyces oceani]
SLAARFAAKEALAKALGAPRGLRWTDAEVVSEDSGRPRLVVRGTVAERATTLGVTTWHVSLSHDAGVASAVVI